MKQIQSKVDLKIETNEENMKLRQENIRLSQDQVEMLLVLADKLNKQEILTKEEQKFLMKPFLYKK